MQPDSAAHGRYLKVAENMILGVLFVSLISLCLILIRSGLSLTS
jgi:hypothetical protein